MLNTVGIALSKLYHENTKRGSVMKKFFSETYS